MARRPRQGSPEDSDRGVQRHRILCQLERTTRRLVDAGCTGELAFRFACEYVMGLEKEDFFRRRREGELTTLDKAIDALAEEATRG